MEINERLESAIKLIPSIPDWGDETFTWDKCYVSSVFSYLAYDYLTEYEIDNSQRIKIIPCDHFIKELSTRKKSDYKKNTFPNMPRFNDYEAENTIIIDGDDLVTCLIKTPQLIFISMRGTANTEDLLLDLECLPMKMNPHKSEKRKYHSGFFNAVMGSYEKILVALASLDPSEKSPIVVTGHSLGGAMASIFYDLFSITQIYRFHYEHYDFLRHFKKLDDSRYLEYLQHSGYSLEGKRPVSCYTFGMPRHKNKYSLVYSKKPYHIHNDFDPVPSIPPKLFIYTDNKLDRCIDESCELVRPNKKGSLFLKLNGLMPQFLSPKYHKMELYMNRLQRKVQL